VVGLKNFRSGFFGCNFPLSNNTKQHNGATSAAFKSIKPQPFTSMSKELLNQVFKQPEEEQPEVERDEQITEITPEEADELAGGSKVNVGCANGSCVAEF